MLTVLLENILKKSNGTFVFGNLKSSQNPIEPIIRKHFIRYRSKYLHHRELYPEFDLHPELPLNLLNRPLSK